MHFTNAVLEESFRCTGLVFASVPHNTTAPIECGGYTIPANTSVFGNLYYIMNDPEVWEDPCAFKPERFLDQDGVFHHNERVIPFGIGKRYCMGQSLAEMEYFLFFVGLIQAFKFTPAKGEKLPSYHPDEYFPKNVIRNPPIFSVKMEKW